MNARYANSAWPACISALRLDRWIAGELGPAESEKIQTHAGGCEKCASAVEALRSAREAVMLPPLAIASAREQSSRPFRVHALLAMVTAGLAAAAGLVLFLRPHAPVERTKGAGIGLGMYALHDGGVRQVVPGEAVAPGDSVRFTVTTPEPAYVAVLSVDPAGRASVYFPDGPRAAPVSAGTDEPLPLATRLDTTTGEERVIGLFCRGPIELEPLRAAIEVGALRAIPEGCQVTRWSFVKR